MPSGDVKFQSSGKGPQRAWPVILFGKKMRLLLPAVVTALLCGCGRDTHVRNKVYSILPVIEQGLREENIEQVFAPEVLNPWVRALDTSRVVTCLQLALDEMPRYRQAVLWMLKAYASEEMWSQIAARYPDIASKLPSVAGYGEHPKISAPDDAANQRSADRSKPIGFIGHHLSIAGLLLVVFGGPFHWSGT